MPQDSADKSVENEDSLVKMQVSEASGTLEEEEMPLMKMREDHTNVCQMSAVGASEIILSQDYQELLKEEDWVSKKTFEVESSMGGLENCQTVNLRCCIWPLMSVLWRDLV